MADGSITVDVLNLESTQNLLAEMAEQLACVRQALPEALRDSLPSVAVTTMTAGMEHDRSEIDGLRTKSAELAREAHTWWTALKDATQQLEATNTALARVVAAYDAYRRRGVSPAPAEYAQVVDAIEDARGILRPNVGAKAPT